MNKNYLFLMNSINNNANKLTRKTQKKIHIYL